jgi:hypothetical protein
MKDLGEVMVEAMLLEFGREEVVQRFSDPGWFQSFGCTLGFDWHSSGLTTVVCGALKEALNRRSEELGLYLAGGKGATSRKTPDELRDFVDSDAPELPLSDLQNASRRTAQVDSSALQDGFEVYHHVFFVSRDGDWTVIQQGIDETSGWARRYHWWNETAGNFLDDPHEGIASEETSGTLNLANPDSGENRSVSVEMVEEDPVGTLGEFTRLLDYWDDTKRRLELPDRHSLPRKDHLERSLGKLYEKPPDDFSDLMDREGVGKKTIRALSMVADVVWGAQPSYEDPARYSFAHGGKDGYPYPVNQDRYRESIDVLSDAIRRSKLGDDSKVKAFKRLKSSFGEEGPTPVKMGSSGDPAPSVSNDPPDGPSPEDPDNQQYSLDF